MVILRHIKTQQSLQKAFILAIFSFSNLSFYLELGVDRVENISVCHIDMSIIVNKHCWEVIAFNQSLAGWETAVITVQMKLPTVFLQEVM